MSVETSQLVMTRVVRSSDGQRAVCIMYVIHQRTVEFKDNEHLEVSLGDVTGARPVVVSRARFQMSNNTGPHSQLFRVTPRTRLYVISLIAAVCHTRTV